MFQFFRIKITKYKFESDIEKSAGVVEVGTGSIGIWWELRLTNVYPAFGEEHVFGCIIDLTIHDPLFGEYIFTHTKVGPTLSIMSKTTASALFFFNSSQNKRCG